MCTVKNLGSDELEHMIRGRLEQLLKNHPDVRASVMGSHNNDNWEVKVQNTANQKSWCATLTLHDNQNAEKVIKFVEDGIETVK